MKVIFLKGKLYDNQNKEIHIPEGYNVVSSKGEFSLIKDETEIPMFNFIYRAPEVSENSTLSEMPQKSTIDMPPKAR